MSAGRRDFLIAFLLMFDRAAVTIDGEDAEAIEATVRWEDDDEQSVRWHRSVTDLPTADCMALAEFIGAERLLDVDELTLSRLELCGRFLRARGEGWDERRFDIALDDLLAIRVAMIDDGVESDAFFMHE